MLVRGNVRWNIKIHSSSECFRVPFRTIAEFQSISLENEIVDAVTKSFDQINFENQTKDLRFAVRSSAIGEKFGL